MKKAYGGVVVNDAGEILLREVANHWDGYVWTFPKGRPEPSETPEEAALREVLEETGVTARIVKRIPGTFAGGTTENVYFVMKMVAHDHEPEPAETATIRWVSLEDAPSLIDQTTNTVGRDRDRAVLEAAHQFVQVPIDPTTEHGPAPKNVGRELDGRFAHAVAYAARAHRDQVRKGSDIPYLAHVVSVGMLVLEHGGTEAQATAGVLHDVVEDQGGRSRLHDVRMHFGDDVADMVEHLSDAMPEPGDEKAPWRERKEQYLTHLGRLVETGADAVLVSACDKLHNAESIVADATDPDGNPGLGVFKRFTGRAEGTAWYYRSLLQCYERGQLPTRLLVRIGTAIDRLEALANASLDN